MDGDCQIDLTMEMESKMGMVLGMVALVMAVMVMVMVTYSNCSLVLSANMFFLIVFNLL